MKRHLLRRRLRLGYLLACGDALLVVAALAISYGLLSAIGALSVTPGGMAAKLATGGLVLVGVQVSVLYVLGLYALPKSLLDWRHTVSLILAVAAGALLSSGVLYFTPRFLIGRQVLLMHVPLLFALLLAWRQILYRSVISGEPPRRLAVAGSRRAVLDFIADLGQEDLCDYVVTRAYVPPGDAAPDLRAAFAGDRIEWCEDFEKLVGTPDYHALALEVQAFGVDHEVVRRVLEVGFAGVPIYDLTTLQKDLTGRYPPRRVDGASILAAIATRIGPSRYYWRAKRLADVVLGGAALLIAALPMLVIAALVKLESRGPAFFVQQRIGHRRRPFLCIKFRTMVADAEARSGPVWAAENDPRITRLGALLRKTRLDELPQLWNVVRGEMTLVGPRPIRAHFADELARRVPFYDLRFAVKPGLTGWAQVHQRYVRSHEEQELKFRYELFYLENFSLWLDLYTLVKTLRVVVTRRGG